MTAKPMTKALRARTIHQLEEALLLAAQAATRLLASELEHLAGDQEANAPEAKALSLIAHRAQLGLSAARELSR